MDIRHPTLEKRNFFKVYNSGSGLWSFIYAILAALYSPLLHRNVMHYKESYKKFTKKIEMESLNIKRGNIKDLKMFLQQNKNWDVSVNLYEGRLSHHSPDIQVWKYGKLGDGKSDINVLHIFQYVKKKKRHYYFYIKNIFAIKHLFQKRHPCLQCFERFTSKDRLLNHLKNCSIPQRVYPTKGSLISYDKKSEAKYASILACVGFADFETKLCTISSKDGKLSICKQCNDQNCLHLSYTNKIESHELISYSLAFIDAKSTLIFEKH